MNDAQKRINEDVGFEFPKNDIRCKTCAFKLLPIDGYERFTNAYCEIYKPEIAAKPNEILFDNADCEYYMKEDDVT